MAQQTTDELEIYVPNSVYDQQIGILDGDIEALRGILAEYQKLEQDANQVFGDDDANLEKVRANVQANIATVQGNINRLIENRNELQKQREAIENLGTDAGRMLDEGLNLAKQSLRTMKNVSELLG